MKNLFRVIVVLAGFMVAGQTFAATGGGATIHNVARLNFDGGEVVAWVNVEVATIATAPTITSTTTSANTGESATLVYTITSNSNGSDHYNFAATSNNVAVGAPGSLNVAPAAGLTLAASIVVAATNTGANTGDISIPAGSEIGFSNGDTVRVTVSGTEYLYLVTNVVPGTIAQTSGNVTTPEVYSTVTLQSIDGAPAISAANVLPGAQVGEVETFTVTLDAGTLTNPGTPGEHEITVTVTTSETDEDGDVVTETNNTGKVTVLSGTAILIKEVRNITTSSAWFNSSSATTLIAKSGEVLEYRLTVSPIPSETVTGAVLQDSIPSYTTYVADSTTLNGAAVADVAGVTPLVAGLSVNTASGAAGVLVDGESAVVLFRVTVE